MFFYAGFRPCSASILNQGWEKRDIKLLMLLTEKLAVRAQTDDLQGLSIRLAVDEQQIGLKVALSMVAPLSSEGVVAIPFRQWLVLGKQGECRHQCRFQVAAMLPSTFAFIVPAEGVGALNPPHSSRPSI